MTPTALERKIRAGLAIPRFLQAYIPLPVVRWAEKRALQKIKVPDGITHEVVSANGVRCEWLIPANSPKDKVLLYLHGGGFVFGVTSIHREMVAYLAKQMGVRALFVDYRLAPEHPFPAALEDCVTSYRWLVQSGFAASNIVIAGDSAGGNLTLTTLMNLRDDHDPLPAAAACLSPVSDLHSKEQRFQEVEEPLLHPKAMRFFNSAYVGSKDIRNPLISPVFGNWRGLPPLLVHAGEDEVLGQDAVQVQEKASAAGVAVELKIYPRMWHVWQLNLALPQATQSLDEIATFLQSHLQSATT